MSLCRNASSLMLLVWVLLGAGCGKEAPPPAPVVRPVRVYEVSPATRSRQTVLAGVTRAGIESRLSFRVSGSVDRVAVQVGDAVERGRFLCGLDPTDFELKVEEAEAALAQARAAVRQAQADYARVRALYENNNAAKSDLDAARAAAESAQARVEASEKQLEQAQRQLKYTELRAPLDGAIAEVDVEVNEHVQAGGKVLLLTSGAVPEVTVAVPESLISFVRRGQPATVTLGALPGVRLDGEVSEVGVAATGGAAGFDVRVRLTEPNPLIRSGMAADVHLRFDDPQATMIQVPPVAVGEDRDGRFVYVVESGPDGTATVHRRAVQVGQFTPQGIEIRDGLQAGERVVTAGVRRLSEGMQVRPAAEDVVGE